MGSRDRTTQRRIARTLALACGLVSFAVAPAQAAPGQSRDFPVVDASGIQGIKLFDLGVADTNDDGNLDIFTINHKFDSSLLLGTGFGTFTEGTAAIGLNPTPAFPGLEALRRDPVRSSPGLYIYATDRDEPRDPLHIDAVGAPASGRIVFGTEALKVEDNGGAELTATTLPNGRTEMTFVADAGEEIDVSVDHIDLPIEVSIDPPTEPADIRVGADALPATSRQFELNLRDRHGYAFADFDGDGLTDLFAVSGGLGGDISEPFFTPLARDELLLNRSGRYLNATTGSGLVKGGCRGRAADVGDLNGDGILDLLEGCEEAPPRVYLGNGAGGFVESPGPANPATAYRLIDLLGGSRMEILAAVGGRVVVWRNVGDVWAVAQRVGSRGGDLPIEHLSLGDLEGDGDLDVLGASGDGNALLRNEDGRLRRASPARYGLPTAARAATFVDFDNDGDLDLHLMPQGLYEAEDGRFRRTRRLVYDRAGLNYAIDNWADFDGDGRRDLLTARGRDEFAPALTVELRRNASKAGHWLALDLLGPAGNAQAIGARAGVRVGDRWIHQWVGQNDDARFSSGNYRLHFGLGEDRRVRKLVVRWPDGTKKVRKGVRGDRLLRIAQPSAQPSG